MANPALARMLGDVGENAAEHWRWGRTQPDVILPIYGVTEHAIAWLEATIRGLAAEAGVGRIHAIPLYEVWRGKPGALRRRHLAAGGPRHLQGDARRRPDPPGRARPGASGSGRSRQHAAAVRRLRRLRGARADEARDLGSNGSFLVVRQLEQDGEAFSAYCEKQAGELAEMCRFGEPYPLVVDSTEDEKKQATEFIGAKLVGRWKDGSSIVRYPYVSRTRMKAREAAALRRAARERGHPQGATAAPESVVRSTAQTAGAAPPVQAPPSANNDFVFGAEDPEALSCPFGAHIRRANPRDSLDPSSDEEVRIVNRHWIMRVGRPYAS